MTTLLDQAIERLRQLPEDEQDRIASSLMEEMESENGWDRRFAESGELLESMAAEALANLREGHSLPLDPETL